MATPSHAVADTSTASARGPVCVVGPFLLLLLASQARAHVVVEPALPALAEYWWLGVEHILGGFDHLVFLIGVVLITRRTRDVLLAVTAFTLAHSITLALSVLEIATLSPSLVEPLIALSVAYVGVENFFPDRSARRYRLTFVFGLVHGFGFAGALRESGLPREQLAQALGLFNLGVEAGQLAVLAVLLPLLAWLRRSERGVVIVSRVVNVALVLLGVGWALERSLASEPVLAGAAEQEMQPAGGERVQASSALLVSARPTVGSVYATSTQRSELAAELCAATQRLPRERRAACSGGSPGVTLERECTRVLSAALASSALQLNAAQAKACIAAQQARYGSCEFSSAVALASLPECDALWTGRVRAGDSCRSSLECEGGLHCHGLSPLDAGTCGLAKLAGAGCGQGGDTLESYVPKRSDDAQRECSGSCQHGRCVD
jgi:hydrogenase/urease accessory protein HupE